MCARAPLTPGVQTTLFTLVMLNDILQSVASISERSMTVYISAPSEVTLALGVQLDHLGGSCSLFAV